MIRIFHVALLLGSLAAGTFAALAQPEAEQGCLTTPPPGFTGSFRISGIVLSATTGARLDRAEVTLSIACTHGAELAETVTGQDGAFQFDRLPSGKYRLHASRSGYLTAGYDEHDGFNTAIVTGPGLDSINLHFRLLPQASIDGIVTDEAGEAVVGAKVFLFRQKLGRTVRARTGFTDDMGDYGFTRLEAGNYMLAVAGAPWYAFHPQPKRNVDGNLPADDDQPRSPLDVAYPITFYPGTTDSDSAQIISVGAGDRQQVNLSLHPVPALSLLIHIPRVRPNEPIAIPGITQRIFGMEFSPGFSIGRIRNGEYVEIDGLAPGQYDLQFRSDVQGRLQNRNRLTNVNLSDNETIDPTLASAGADVTGKLAMADGSKLPYGLAVSLRPAEGQGIDQGEPVAEDGTFTLYGVSPGTYELVANASGLTLALTRMAVSDGEYEGDLIKVGSQPVLLAGMLSRGSATLTGFAKQDGKGVGGVMVVLVPRNPKANRELFRRDQSASDGSFILNHVVPGSYSLVAIEDGWALDWTRPEVIEHYLARGLKIEVPERRNNINLPQAIEVQARERLSGPS